MLQTAKLIVLVTGVPGLRKTALARHLSAALKRPLAAMHVIEDSLAAHFEEAEADWWRLRKASADILWTILADSPTGAVVDVAADSADISEGLSRVGRCRIAEIFCTGSAGCQDSTCKPLLFGPSRTVDLSQPVDTEELLIWVLCLSLTAERA